MQEKDYDGIYEETATVEITLAEYRDLVTLAAVHNHELNAAWYRVDELEKINKHQAEQILHLQEQISLESDCNEEG